MRKVMAGIVALGMAAPASAAPPIRNGGNIGLGLGATTAFAGIDVKYWIEPKVSFQMVLGAYDIGRGFDAFAPGLDGEFLYEQPLYTGNESFDFGLHVGAGGLFATSIDGDFDLVAGANVVVGLEFNIDAVPLDVSIDYRPTILFLDDINGLDDDFRLDLVELGAHVRYWF